ncbi:MULTISPECIES: SIMPL domain-containing protein [unclassified Herbaspirillum]|uniref:SIMPL domain-containing protein n=1 Tax=unclassified Herbaspirillum TaxID=2624150 RepID=UPI00115059DB|nr:MULTISPECIES: SIMPL domain-containing protein [unclassified Herbaspirillum]MBB5392174.1 putative secreted protein [Herbaspirillum sp. SJZ102]TQK13631.1 putative secreted protein [Herbaspirillum sp. SJZ130]TQK15634.1 putative secreted protein [Herbaspirillum sp. SJZ106]TWC71533.1 putative secreted protein [Herbaspirillum sp. SJZ099]
MTTTRKLMLGAALATACMAVQAQAIQTTGSMVVVPATGELSVPNDQARVTLQVEEQDKDKTAAASRVNQKMKQGIDIIKRQDPQATLKSYGYYTYAIYAEPQPVTPPQPRAAAKARPIVGWRVGQYLEVVTQNLAGLPKTVSSAQSLLSLNGLQFGLSPAATKKLDAALFDATYKNLEERIGFIAASMHRTPSDAVLETLDFEGSGNYAGNDRPMAPKAAMMMRSDMAPEAASVAEPSFEPGESTVGMRLVGKVRFK